MANTMEQALLLPTDMADLRSMRKHEVFLSLKTDLAMVSVETALEGVERQAEGERRQLC